MPNMPQSGHLPFLLTNILFVLYLLCRSRRLSSCSKNKVGSQRLWDPMLLRSQREEESKRRLIVLLEVEEVGSDGRMERITFSLLLLQILSKNGTTPPLPPPLVLAHEQARELCGQVARISVQICICQPNVRGQNKNFHQPLRPNYQICSQKIQRTSVLGKQRCEKLSIDSISLTNILTLSFASCE